MSDTKHLEKIAALLRKAEGTDNEHEQDAFFTAAQKLATKHSIDLAIARAHTARREAREVPENRTVTLGAKGKRGLAAYVQLFSAIARANDVECFIAHDSTRIYPMGFPSDLDVVEALYASLVIQMVQAGDRYLKSGEHKSETTTYRVRTTDFWGDPSYEYVTKPVDGRTARRSFYAAFTSRIRQRLLEAKREAEAQAVEHDEETPTTRFPGQEVTSTAIVLREKKAEVTAYVAAEKKRQGIRGSWRGSKASSGYSSHAANAGDRAARSARLTGQSALPAGRASISA